MTTLELISVTKHFTVDGELIQALTNISFTAEEGKITCILGHSGCGKTTLLNLIAGLDTPTAGKINVYGVDISKFKPKDLAKYNRLNIGMVYQFYNVVESLNVLDNVKLIKKLSRRSFNPIEMIKAVGLEHRYKHYPKELSGGERQRLSIARAVCKNPDILLCDEPTGALDITSGRQILELLREMAVKYNKTVIVVTHNRSIATFCDKIVTLTKNGYVESVYEQDNPVSIEEVNW